MVINPGSYTFYGRRQALSSSIIPQSLQEDILTMNFHTNIITHYIYLSVKTWQSKCHLRVALASFCIVVPTQADFFAVFCAVFAHFVLLQAVVIFQVGLVVFLMVDFHTIVIFFVFIIFIIIIFARFIEERNISLTYRRKSLVFCWGYGILTALLHLYFAEFSR